MVTPGASTEPVLSAAEAIEAVEHMSAADLLRFKKASHYLSFGGARPPADLRHEAIRRLAEDTRHCPRHLPIAVTLFGIMRSIASSDRKAIKRRADLAVVPTNESLTTVSYGGVDPRQSPEDRIILEEAAAGLKAGILKLFDDDAIAQLLVEGMIDEMEGKELRNLLGLNEKDFASKRRLVRRRIDKAKLNGWKS